jgi:hypothetical protein
MPKDLVDALAALMRSFRWLLALVLTAGLASASNLAANDTCSASCLNCPCSSSSLECQMICTIGYYPSCSDGFCGGGPAKCCCRLQGPLQGPPECSNQPCGDLSTPCAAHRTRPEAGSPDKRACRELVSKKGEQERWGLVEAQVIPGRSSHLFSVIAASSQDFADGLQSCHRQGWLADDFYESGDQRTFFYVASRDTFGAGARSVRLEIPDGELPPTAGRLAVKLIMDGQGQVLATDLLFSTDETLGRHFVAGVADWLRVVDSGSGPGPFLDVLYVVVQEGEMQTFLQIHRSLTAPELQPTA